MFSLPWLSLMIWKVLCLSLFGGGNPDQIKCLTLCRPVFAGGGGMGLPISLPPPRGLNLLGLNIFAGRGCFLDTLFFDVHLKEYGKSFLFHCKDIMTNNCFLNDV